ATADGVKVPLVTDAEKRERRQTVTRKRKEKRARRGRRRPRLRAAKKGADQRYKQFNVVAFNDQGQERRLGSVTRRAGVGGERRVMIDYPAFERRGWNIGTGPVESMCKVTTWRVKGPGMRWDGDNAEAMVALECLRQSNLWDAYWKLALGRN